MPDRGRRPPHLAHTSPGRISCSQRAGSPAIENFLVRRPPAHARRAGAPAAHAAPPDRRPSSAGSAAPADGGNAAPVGLGSCGANFVRGVRRPGAHRRTRPLARKSNISAAYSRSDCDGWCAPRVRRGCDGRFAPVAAQNPRNSAAFGRSGANLRATGATGRFAPRRTQNPRKSAALRLSVRRLGANCEPGFVGCRWRNIAGRPPVSVFAKEGPK